MLIQLLKMTAYQLQVFKILGRVKLAHLTLSFLIGNKPFT